VWHQGIRLRYPKVEFVEVPYERTTLAALFMPAQDGRGQAPTVVVVNGMDNAKEMSIFFCGLEFARRGYNTLCLDGPGMGEMRRMRDMPSRYDYEVPGTAAFEYLAKRKDVDAKRIAIMGYSFGGYYSSRIAAFEKRYAACIALSALHWDLAGWQQHIKEKNANAPKSVAQSNFQFQWVVGAATPDEAIEIARKFTLKDVAQNITCPFLVTHGGNDRVVPVQNAQKLYDAVGSKNKTLKIFSTEEGGAEHAHVDNRQVGIEFAADWLGDNL
jgi:dipeptidyl aminopeptidase/acylaminoacyl peptidase